MRPDELRVIEAVYTPASDEEHWLRNVVAAVHALLDCGLGVLGYSYAISYPISVRTGPVVEQGGSGDKVPAVARIVTEPPPHVIEKMYTFSGAATLSEFLGSVESQLAISRELEPFGVRDCIGIVSSAPTGVGVVINVALPETRRLQPAFRRVWAHLAAHLGAGFRLQLATHTGAAATEAVLDPSGKIHHAEGPARGRDSASALRQAARVIDRARAKRAKDPAAAVELWKTLVEERWSLVDQFDSDGRHFLIAYRNQMQAPPVRQLSESERRVIALAALGRSNKLIAYELGLSTGTVGTRSYGVGLSHGLFSSRHRATSANTTPPLARVSGRRFQCLRGTSSGAGIDRIPGDC